MMRAGASSPRHGMVLRRGGPSSGGQRAVWAQRFSRGTAALFVAGAGACARLGWRNTIRAPHCPHQVLQLAAARSHPSTRLAYLSPRPFQCSTLSHLDRVALEGFGVYRCARSYDSVRVLQSRLFAPRPVAVAAAGSSLR